MPALSVGLHFFGLVDPLAAARAYVAKELLVDWGASRALG